MELLFDNILLIKAVPMDNEIGTMCFFFFFLFPFEAAITNTARSIPTLNHSLIELSQNRRRYFTCACDSDK